MRFELDSLSESIRAIAEFANDSLTESWIIFRLCQNRSGNR